MDFYGRNKSSALLFTFLGLSCTLLAVLRCFHSSGAFCSCRFGSPSFVKQQKVQSGFHLGRNACAFILFGQKAMKHNLLGAPNKRLFHWTGQSSAATNKTRCARFDLCLHPLRSKKKKKTRFNQTRERAFWGRRAPWLMSGENRGN